MKILFDYQIFSIQRFGGISRYFYEIMKRFYDYNEVSFMLSLLYSNNEYIKKSKFYNKFILKGFIFPGRYKIENVINKLYSKILLKHSNYDIFHPTYYDSYFIKYLGKKPFVLTVYDMIHEKFRNLYNHKDKTIEIKKYLMYNAKKIIAISRNTKKDILNYTNIKENKIEVIYLANSLSIDNELQVSSNNTLNNLPNNYILFVGRRDKYKNFGNLVKAIGKLLYEDKDLYLLCVGGGNFTPEERNMFYNMKIANKIYHLDVDDYGLTHLYRQAKLFVFPSLYEGFGIPILEAFANDCPVVCSNRSALPEVAGKAALYFDPEDIRSIKSSVEIVLENSKLRASLIEKGKNRIKYFTWDKTAKETIELYKKLL